MLTPVSNRENYVEQDHSYASKGWEILKGWNFRRYLLPFEDVDGAEEGRDEAEEVSEGDFIIFWWGLNGLWVEGGYYTSHECYDTSDDLKPCYWFQIG